MLRNNIVPDETFNVAVVGRASVGKSAICIQYIQNFFVSEYDPTIADTYTKKCIVDVRTLILNLLDTAGQEELGSVITEGNMRSADGFLLVFSLTDRNSCDEIRKYHQHIMRLKDRDSFPMLLVGNKSDQDRLVTCEEVLELVSELGVPYIECSAKECIHVEECVHELVRIIRRFRQNERRTVSFPKTKEQKCCNLM